MTPHVVVLKKLWPPIFLSKNLWPPVYMWCSTLRKLPATHFITMIMVNISHVLLQARSQEGGGGETHHPKSRKKSTFSDKVGQKFGFCWRVKGGGSKNPLLGSKRSNFWESRTSPKSILATGTFFYVHFDYALFSWCQPSIDKPPSPFEDLFHEPAWFHNEHG